MDLTLRYFRINNYILTSLSEKRKGIVEYYIQKYNPFYEWEIGSLKESEIQATLSVYFSSGNTGEKIKKNIVNSIAFSLLLNSYREIAGELLPEKLAIDKWLEIRKHFEIACKNENERRFEEITYNDTFIARPASSAEIADEIDKNIQGIEIIVEVILKTCHISDWKTVVRESDNEKYDYTLIIIKSKIEKEKLELVIPLLRNKFSKSIFNIKSIQDNYYIEGLINI